MKDNLYIDSGCNSGALPEVILLRPNRNPEDSPKAETYGSYNEIPTEFYMVLMDSSLPRFPTKYSKRYSSVEKDVTKPFDCLNL